MATKVVPLGRFGKPEDVAGMVLFLCSEFASFITAASIDVSGGLQGQIAYYPTLKRELMEVGIAREQAALASEHRTRPRHVMSDQRAAALHGR